MAVIDLLGFHRQMSVACFENSIKLMVCQDTKQIVEGLKILGDCNVIGLDCEWRPKDWKGKHEPVANVHKVAVLQLASSKACIVIQLLLAINKGCILPSELFELLSSSGVLKVGVGIFNDCRKLETDYGLVCRGLVDLRNLARREELQLRAESLQGLSAWAGLKLSKDPSVRLSDWAAPRLNSQQIRYACEDAIAGLAILEHMHKMKRATLSVADTERLLSTDETLAEYCTEFRDIDVPSRSDKLKLDIVEVGSDVKRRGRPLKDASSVPTRKSDLYHNCRLEAPDGSVLANLDHDRAAWYLRKGLAVILHTATCTANQAVLTAAANKAGSDRRNLEERLHCDQADLSLDQPGSARDQEVSSSGTAVGDVDIGAETCTCMARPGAIRLLFEPKGRGHEGNEYYTSPKANVCVACGAASNLQRYSVVPPMYRRLMPEALKSRSSFDIVLLCTTCHQQADCHAATLRATLARECAAPLTESSKAMRDAAESAVKEARSLAKALLTVGEKLPQQRRTFAEATLVRYFEVI